VTGRTSVFRYLILVWNINSASDCDAARTIRRRMQISPVSWLSVFDRPGMYVACDGHEFSSDAAIPFDNGRGVILGTMFPSSAPRYSGEPTPIRLLPLSHSDEVLRSMGRSLISSFWGYYVAALHYPENAGAIVLRAPACSLPCFHAEQGTVHVFFSRLDDCIDLKLSPLSINWDSITAQVAGGDYLSNEPAFREIHGIECGESVHCNSSGCTRQTYWDPRSFLEERFPMKFDEAAQTVRNVTEHCVRALSSAHGRILVKVSGGLDSSIVLSSLSRAPHRPSVTAVNYFSRGSGDERSFARNIAGATNCPLVERPRNRELDFRCFLDCNRTVRPVLNFSAPDTEVRNIALARELNATAIFDGELGDNLFGSHPGPGALVECFRQSGLGRGFLGVALDYSLLTRQSLWRTLAVARREARSAAANPDFSVASEMLSVRGAKDAGSVALASAAAVEHSTNMGDRLLHPWLKQSRRIAVTAYRTGFARIAVRPHYRNFCHLSLAFFGPA
jgi:asparagine synthase (glutamine-hydrolysing)